MLPLLLKPFLANPWFPLKEFLALNKLSISTHSQGVGIIFFLCTFPTRRIQFWIQSSIFFLKSFAFLRLTPSHSYRIGVRSLVFLRREFMYVTCLPKYTSNCFSIIFNGCVKLIWRKNGCVKPWVRPPMVSTCKN